MTATDKATDVVADVAEEVADQAQYVAEVTRGADSRRVGFAVGAFFVGAGVGGGLAFLLTRRRLETKFSQIADDEIAEMREHYQEKLLAREAEDAKGNLEDIVAERGYTTPETDTRPPMAVAPPSEIATAGEEPSPPTEPRPEPETHNVFADHADTVTAEWDYEVEKRRRSPDQPYVIHYDERHEFEGYSEVTLSYYEADDVLCNERDEIIDPEHREEMVGEGNLERFGHGSNDPHVVYIRNDKLEIVFEVVKSPNSYAEEVHGFRHTGGYSHNIERMRHRENDPDDD